VSIAVGESGKNEDEVMLMPIRKVFAYEHCFYAKKGIRCRRPSDEESLADFLRIG